MKNKMPSQLRMKLKGLCFRSKMGERMHPEDLKFFNEMFNKYEEEYEEVDKEVQEMAKKAMNSFYEKEEEGE